MSKESALAMATGSPEPIPASAPVIGGPPPTPIEPPKDMESARFAAQARKEAEFVKKQQALKAEQEKFESEKKEILARRKTYDETMERAKQFEDTRKTDPVAALKLIGFSETDIFNFLAGQEKKEATPAETAAEVATKVAEELIEKKLSAKDKEQADKEAKLIADRDAGLINEFKSGLGSVVEANKDKYEYCAHYGPAAIDLAYRTVLQIVEDSKGEDIPTAEEAIQMIEELYEEEDKALMSLKKRQPKVEATEVETKAAPERTRTVSTPTGHTPVAPAIQKTRALSNAARPTTAAATRTVNETREQKKERLMEALRRGKL
jgi:hypothetical protein